jgi:hypothetical protein
MAPGDDLESTYRYRQVRYLFDVALRPDRLNGSASATFAATGAPFDADRLVGLVRRSGADGCDLRILASDGARYAGVLAEVADRLRCDVYYSPSGADVRPAGAEVRPATPLNGGRRGEAVAVDRASGRLVRWLLVRPSDVSPAAPTWFERTDGAVRPRTGPASVPLPNGVAFAVRSTFTHLCGLASWYPDDPPEVSTVIVGNRDGAFEIGQYDGSVHLVDGPGLAELVHASLDSVGGDVRLATRWPPSDDHRTRLEAQIARFAATLNRVVRASDPDDDAAGPRRVPSPRTWYGWLSVLQPQPQAGESSASGPAEAPAREGDGGSRAGVRPHTIGWLPPSPPVNREPVELFAWSEWEVDDTLDVGLPVAEPYLLLYADPRRLAARKRRGHLLSVSVPAGSAVDLFELDGTLPAPLRHQVGDAPDTFLLPVAWLTGVMVTAGYDLDGAGGFAATHRVGGRPLSVQD